MSRPRRFLLLAGSGILVAASLALALAAMPIGSSDPNTSTYGYLKLFNEVVALIRNSYVESVSENELVKGAYDGLLAALDGESEYVTAAQYRSLKASPSRDEGETGVFLTRREGILFVAAILPGSDAQEKGLRLGDQVRRIGDRNGRELNLSEAEQALRGPVGSRISIAVSRREEPRREDLELTRRRIALPPPRLDPPQQGVAIVRLPTFGPGSSKALSGILDRLSKEKAGRAIFDLRGNAWGETSEAVRAASLLVGEGVVFKIRDRQGAEHEIKGTGPRKPWSGNLLLLTDPGAAGAAEIFVAAVLDSGVATQAGEPTLGRGGEKEFIALANGDYLALTVRKYLSPSGKDWHGKGLTPSVPIPLDTSLPLKERAGDQLHKAVESLLDREAQPKAA